MKIRLLSVFSIAMLGLGLLGMVIDSCLYLAGINETVHVGFISIIFILAGTILKLTSHKGSWALLAAYVFASMVTIFICEALENTNWGQTNIDKVFDIVIKEEAEKAAEISETTDRKTADKMLSQIIFIETDTKALITPRYELAEAVRNAYSGGAKIIILDMIFDHADCCHPSSDLELRTALEEMTARNSGTKVIFPVAIDSEGNIRSNIFQRIIERNPNFYLATAEVAAPTTDNVVRYWLPFRVIKNEPGHKMLWNGALLAVMLAEGKEQELRKIESDHAAGKQRDEYNIKLSNGRDVRISSRNDMTDKGDLFSNRIRYSLIPAKTMEDHRGGNLFETIYKIKESKEPEYKDKIVIIGNSSRDMGDVHKTPIGSMPGMFIVGNTIATIQKVGASSTISGPGLILLDVLIALIISLIFVAFDAIRIEVPWLNVTPLVSIVIPIGCLVVSIKVMEYFGVFLNLVAVSIIVAIVSDTLFLYEKIRARRNTAADLISDNKNSNGGKC